MARPEFAELAHTIEALEAQKSQKNEQIDKLKQEERDLVKKAEQVRKRGAKAAEELAVTVEINKNLKYSIVQLAQEEPDLVQLQRIEQIKNQIVARNELIAAVRDDISQMMADL